MENRSKYLIFVIVFLLSLSSSYAIILKAENVQNEIKENENESASFDLSVGNDNSKDIEVFVTAPYSTDWNVNINPYILKIPAKAVKTANIQTFSLNDGNFGSFDLVLNVKSRDLEIDESFTYNVKVIPLSGEEVVLKLNVPEKIDPRAGAKIKLKIDNMRKTDYNDLIVSVKSEGFFTEKRFVDLESRDTKIEEFSLGFPEDSAPGKYKLEAEARYGGKILGKTSAEFLLADFSDVVEKISYENKLLERKVIISKINGGTEEKQDKITYSVSNYKKMIVKFSKEPDSFVLKDGMYVAEWNFKLAPNDVFKVEIINDYMRVFWGCVVLVALIMMIFHLKRKKIVVKKKVLGVSRDREGISGMKVLLHIKNRGIKSIPDIKLIDTLPTLIGTAPHSFSTLHPIKVKKSSFGTIKLLWEVGTLTGGEERMVSYVANSRLSILGKLILPSAVVVYKKGDRNVKSKSNKLTLFAALGKKDEEK